MVLADLCQRRACGEAALPPPLWCPLERKRIGTGRLGPLVLGAEANYSQPCGCQAVAENAPRSCQLLPYKATRLRAGVVRRCPPPLRPARCGLPVLAFWQKRWRMPSMARQGALKCTAQTCSTVKGAEQGSFKRRWLQRPAAAFQAAATAA